MPVCVCVCARLISIDEQHTCFCHLLHQQHYSYLFSGPGPFLEFALHATSLHVSRTTLSGHPPLSWVLLLQVLVSPNIGLGARHLAKELLLLWW